MDNEVYSTSRIMGTLGGPWKLQAENSNEGLVFLGGFQGSIWGKMY